MKRHKGKIAIYKHRREVWNEVYRIAHCVCVVGICVCVCICVCGECGLTSEGFVCVCGDVSMMSVV